MTEETGFCPCFHALSHDDGYRATAPVGTYRPNPWGLYDMHGNAYEWCRDWDAPYPVRAVVDPTGPDTPASQVPAFRVVRGGAWESSGA